jgi:hypothetical protein
MKRYTVIEAELAEGNGEPCAYSDCPQRQPNGSHYCATHSDELAAIDAAEAEAMACDLCGMIHDYAAPSPQDVEADRLACLDEQRRRYERREDAEARRGFRVFMTAAYRRDA